jgi:hypothetical protein
MIAAGSLTLRERLPTLASMITPNLFGRTSLYRSCSSRARRALIFLMVSPLIVRCSRDLIRALAQSRALPPARQA